MSRRAVLLLLLAVLFFSLGYAVGHSAPPQAFWLTIEDGGRLMLATDHTVRFQGRGHVQFGENRREVTVPDGVQAFVDGAAVTGPRRVRTGETVQLRAGDETKWTLQLSDETAMHKGEGIRITDDYPKDHTRVDSAEPMTFFVLVRPGGQAHFLYPE